MQLRVRTGLHSQWMRRRRRLARKPEDEPRTAQLTLWLLDVAEAGREAQSRDDGRVRGGGDWA